MLAAFPRELLKKVTRANSVGTEEVNLERSQLQIALPRCVIIDLERPLYVRPPHG
jgi:hypothetical protein